MSRDDKDPNCCTSAATKATDPIGRDMTQAEGRMMREAGSSTPGSYAATDQDVRILFSKLITAKTNRIQQAHMEANEVYQLQALFDSLPTKMSYDAAIGLKLLLRNYGNTLLSY